MNTKILANLAIAALLTASCTDLDTYPEGLYITADQKMEARTYNSAIATASVNALFSQMKMYQPNAKAVGDRTNDFGYPAVMLMMESNGRDVVSMNNGYNSFYKDVDFSDRDNTSTQAQIVWGTLYQQIYTANALIANLPEDPDDAIGQAYLSQGLAIRAFNYWVLAQLYQHNYIGHEQAPCVPLITEKNFSDVSVKGCPLASVGDVYNQIISDLDKAIILLEKSKMSSLDKRYINKCVAYGLRARVNLTMQHYDKAMADADNAIKSFNGRPYLINELDKPGFWDSNDQSWMWAIVVSEEDDIVTKGNPEKGICNFASHMGSLNFGISNYCGGRQINKSLFETIPNTDVRRSWWLDATSTTTCYGGVLGGIMKQAGYPPYTNVKFGPYQDQLNTRINANDIPLMRIEEMYLIKAEALAMTGRVAEGCALLNQFITMCRDQQYKFQTADASALQEEIYRQRRIEFWGEGLSWFDLMRLNKGVDRTGAGYSEAASTISIPADNNRLLWSIPKTEIDANPAL